MPSLQPLVEFWKHWYGKLTITGIVGSLGALVMWFVKTRKAWHEGTEAKLRVRKIKLANQEKELKNAVADYIRENSGAIAGDMSERFKLELNVMVSVLMELERDGRIWHTGNGRWVFGSKPEGF